MARRLLKVGRPSSRLLSLDVAMIVAEFAGVGELHLRAAEVQELAGPGVAGKDGACQRPVIPPDGPCH